VPDLLYVCAVEFYESYVLITVKVYQPRGLLEENVPRLKPSPFLAGDHSGITTTDPGLPTSIVEGTTSVTSRDDLNPTLPHASPLPATSAAVTEISDGHLESTNAAHQTIAVEDTVNPSFGESIHPAVSGSITSTDEMPNPLPAEGLVSPLVEQLVHSVSDDLVATGTVPRPAHQGAIRSFSVSLFQCPAVLDPLVQRLRTKRALVHSWVVADLSLKGHGIPPTRYRLEDLDPNEIYEYLKSGGRSVNISAQPIKNKVDPLRPSSDMTWLTPHRHCLH
jgi:hypothetical protein